MARPARCHIEIISWAVALPQPHLTKGSLSCWKNLDCLRPRAKKGPFSHFTGQSYIHSKVGSCQSSIVGVFFFFGFGSLDPKDQLDSYFQWLDSNSETWGFLTWGRTGMKWNLLSFQFFRWWFETFFRFNPIWGRWTHVDEYVSNRLVQPPTRIRFPPSIKKLGSLGWRQISWRKMCSDPWWPVTIGKGDNPWWPKDNRQFGSVEFSHLVNFITIQLMSKSFPGTLKPSNFWKFNGWKFGEWNNMKQPFFE